MRNVSVLQLARYLDRGYWERRRDQQASGVGVAPGGVSQPPQTVVCRLQKKYKNMQSF